MIALTKTAQNKVIKEQKLYDAALELFLEKGIIDTTIDDIVKKSGLAKGTFYLYFKDKDDIVKKLIKIKTLKIVNDALEYLNVQGIGSRDYQFLVEFVDYIIRYLSANKKVMRFIYKDLSYGLLNETIESAHIGEETLMSYLCNKISDSGRKVDNPKIAVFMVFELVGSTCYNTILYDQPLPIEEFKPFLFDAIKKIMRG